MASVIDILKSRRLLAWTVGANALIFFVMCLAALAAKFGGGMFNVLPGLLVLPASFSGWLHRPWTLLTYMFTHADFFHLLFNMLWLLWFGFILLSRLEARRVAALYLGGGIAGGVLYMVGPYVMPGIYTYGSVLLGASASVLALMGAAAILMPDYRLHLFFIGDVKLKWMALVMIVLAFLGLGGGNAGGQVAHIGGVAFGCIFALAVRRGRSELIGCASNRRRKRKNPFEGMQSANPVVQARINAERLDQLLDKIHLSGFNSLTAKERMELEELSKKVPSKPKR